MLILSFGILLPNSKLRTGAIAILLFLFKTARPMPMFLPLV